MRPIRDKTIAKLAAQASRASGSRSSRSTTVDRTAVHELELYAENEAALYNQKKSIIENVKRRMRSGKYDPSLAPKLWLYWFDAAARRYVKEFGGDVATMFPKAVRMAAAESAARDYAERIQSGEYGR
jgi:hypothetical protein